MLAGLSFQVFSLLLFSAACIEFGIRVYRSVKTPAHPYSSNIGDSSRFVSPSSIRFGAPLHTSLPNTLLFRAFLVGLSVATLSIFIRSCFRVAELSNGFDGALANDEVSFMILEGAMIIIACLALTICHPGICFQGEWRAANFKMSKNKNNLRDLEAKRVSTGTSSVSSEEEVGGLEIPAYSHSLVTMDTGLSLEDAASIRTCNLQPGLRATVVTATPVRPGQVHVEMLPVYGIRYESTSDSYPAPIPI